MHLSESDLRFLARFAKSPEGKEFTVLLQAKLGDVEGKLRITEGAELHRQQGRAQQIDELLTDITDAGKKLNAAQSAPRPRRVVLHEGLAA